MAHLLVRCLCLSRARAQSPCQPIVLDNPYDPLPVIPLQRISDGEPALRPNTRSQWRAASAGSGDWAALAAVANVPGEWQVRHALPLPSWCLVLFSAARNRCDRILLSLLVLRS